MRFESSARVICTAFFCGTGLLLAGCAGESNDDPTTGADSVGTDTGTADDDGSASASMTGQTMTGSSMTVGDTGDDGPSTDDGPGTFEDSGTDDGPVVPQPNGSTCAENEECESGYCFVVQFLGGICGECLMDVDCPDGGCSLPNPIAMPPVGAVCNDGGAGEGCQTSEVCQDGLVCASIISVPGILEANTCSECTMDTDCDKGMLCSPTYDVLNISGQKTCVEPGTVVNGEGCDIMSGTGNMACMSGICATINIMDLLMVGVCGECGVDADCDVMAGEVCLPADVDTTTGVVTPPTCGLPK
jgi:hypothetical protein